MNEEELAKSLQEAAKDAIPDEMDAASSDYSFDDSGELGVLIGNAAREIRADYVMATDSGERRNLKQRYDKLDQWLGVFKEIETSADSETVEGLKRKLRAEVLEEFRRWRSKGAAHRQHQKDVDAKRKQLREKSKAGAGAATQGRLKDEIDLLIRNYTPANEQKIEALIDRWRRSGDPSYDPSVNIRLRNARKKSDNAKFAH